MTTGTPSTPRIAARANSTQIRPLARGDVSAVAALYADFDGWSNADLPTLERFFARVLLDHPFADPDLPTLVCEDADRVIGVLASHARRFVHGDRPVRLRTCGPLIVDRAARGRGVGLQLIEHLLDGPQDMTMNDRARDQTRGMWERAGGVTDTASSVGWSHVIAPARFLAAVAARRLSGRAVPPGAALLTRAGAFGRLRRRTPPPGSVEPLAEEALIDLLSQIAPDYPLRPAYEASYLTWLFDEMARADVGEQLVRRLVRDGDGRPAGWYVMYVSSHGVAHVMQIAGAPTDMQLVLDRLVHDAAEHGALELHGRVEPHLLPALRSLRCRLIAAESALLHARDRSLLDAALFGRALLTRMDGEWWMRPARASASV